MKKIIKIEIQPPRNILCFFDDGVVKKVDINHFLGTTVFEPLKNPMNFKQAENRGYFIEWSKWELDLSADTLWHFGTEVLEINLEKESVL